MSKKRTGAALHPEVISRLFGVHLRTVFRWAKKNQRLDYNSIVESLYWWRRTCFGFQAKAKLGVVAYTITQWKNRKLLHEVEVFGLPRVTLASIAAVKKLPSYRPKAKKKVFNRHFRPPPKHETKLVFADMDKIVREIEHESGKFYIESKRRANRRR